MKLLSICVVILTIIRVESRVTVILNANIGTTNVVPNYVDISLNEIDHKENDIANEINDTHLSIPPATNQSIPEATVDSVPPRIDNGVALLLTPLLEEGNQVQARSKSKVNPEHFLGIESYSGFFTVNKTYNSNMFFWYFPVLGRQVNETPWIVWLQGGPGVSSMTGLFDEIGPFRVFNHSLRYNPYTWLKTHSLVFIDNPVGSGFSFTDSFEGLAKNMETYRAHLFSTISQFLQVFPELRTAPLYIAGESYAGKYVPALGLEIHKQKEAGNIDVNLQGFMIGNAFVDPEVISDLTQPMKYFGILQQQQIDIIKPVVDKFKQHIEEKNSVAAKLLWGELISLLLSVTYQKHNYNFLRDDIAVGKYVSFLEESKIRKALHVGDIVYDMVNFTVNNALAPDFLWNSRPVFEELLENYKVLAYCGQLDSMLPCVLSSQNHAKWNWSQADAFRNASRYPYILNGKLGGYHKSGGNFTEMVVRGAGHMVPQDAPVVAFDMVSKFTYGKSYTKPYPLENNVLRVTVDMILKNHNNDSNSNSTTVIYL